MERRERNPIARSMNTLGCSALLIIACTAFFLSRGIKLASAVFIALPAAAAMGLALLMIARVAKERRLPKEAERARLRAVRDALSLATPEQFLNTALPILCAHYGLEKTDQHEALALCSASGRTVAIAAIPVPPGAQAHHAHLIVHHSNASRHKVDRLVILSNEEAESLSNLAARLIDPPVVWMDPKALAALPGAWPTARVPEHKTSILREILKPSRIKGFWRYGAIMLLLWIFFRQLLFLIFGFLCLGVAVFSRLQRAKTVEKNAQPFQ